MLRRMLRSELRHLRHKNVQDIQSQKALSQYVIVHGHAAYAPVIEKIRFQQRTASNRECANK